MLLVCTIWNVEWAPWHQRGTARIRVLNGLPFHSGNRGAVIAVFERMGRKAGKIACKGEFHTMQPPRQLWDAVCFSVYNLERVHQRSLTKSG